MTQKLLAGLLALLFLFNPGSLVADDENKDISVPGRHDWSIMQTLFIAPRVQDLPPVTLDDDGNFYIYKLDRDLGVFEYLAIDTAGNTFIHQQVELPYVDEETFLSAAPSSGGMTIVWASINSDGYWQLYTAFCDYNGSLDDVNRLHYNLNHPNQVIDIPSGLMRALFSLNVAIDRDGRMHLSLTGGLPRQIKAVYLLFDNNLEMIKAEGIAFRHTSLNYSRAFSGGQIIIDDQGTVYVLNDVSGRLFLDIFCPDGSHKTINVGNAAFHLGAWGSGGLYTVRRVGPVMDIDEDGVIHIVHNHLTRPPGLTARIVDVGYIQVRDGKVTVEKVITNEVGVSHYPTVTANGGKVYVVWEETSGNAHELYYSVLNYQGEILSSSNRLTWEQHQSRLGYVYADDRGELHAFWWRSTQELSDRLAYKNTVSPMPDSIWLRLGVDPHDPDNKLTGQVLYYGVMILITGIVHGMANMRLLLLVIFLLFVLYKIQVLNFLLERPWTMFLMLLALMYPLMPRIPAAESAFTLSSGYYLFVWFSASAISCALMLLFKIRPTSTLNLVLGCFLWLLTAVLMQMVPIVPIIFAV